MLQTLFLGKIANFQVTNSFLKIHSMSVISTDLYASIIELKIMIFFKKACWLYVTADLSCNSVLP